MADLNDMVYYAIETRPDESKDWTPISRTYPLLSAAKRAISDMRWDYQAEQWRLVEVTQQRTESRKVIG